MSSGTSRGMSANHSDTDIYQANSLSMQLLPGTSECDEQQSEYMGRFDSDVASQHSCAMSQFSAARGSRTPKHRRGDSLANGSNPWATRIGFAAVKYLESSLSAESTLFSGPWTPVEEVQLALSSTHESRVH